MESEITNDALKRFEERFSKTKKVKHSERIYTIQPGMELGVEGSIYKCTSCNAQTGKVVLKFLRTDTDAL